MEPGNQLKNPSPHVEDIKWKDDETKSVPMAAMVDGTLILEMSRATHDEESRCLEGVAQEKP